MPWLKYVGPLPRPEVEGFGHFQHGEAKLVDVMTACSFRDPRCAAEGWEVLDDDAPSLPQAQDTTTGTLLDEEPVVAPDEDSE